MTDRPPAERAELELENDRLQADLEAAARDFFALKKESRESIEGITATLDATVAAFGREREALRAEVERMKTVAFQAQNAAIDLAQQVATLTAERDAARGQLDHARFDGANGERARLLAENQRLRTKYAQECRDEEREACAKLANWHLNTAAIAVTEPERLRGYRDACADLESAIRARGAK